MKWVKNKHKSHVKKTAQGDSHRHKDNPVSYKKATTEKRYSRKSKDGDRVL